jgi:hypothetical protein
MVRQTVEALRLVAIDERQMEKLAMRSLAELSRMDFSLAPPVISREIHRIIRAEAGNADPYREAKRRFNVMALELLPSFREKISRSADSFASAVRLAIAGNVIDLGAKGTLTEREAFDAVERAFDEPVAGDIDAFKKAILSADRILYLTDNAGEIVFDAPLIGMLPAGKVIVAVRGMPVINDATREDAVVAGITEIAPVIDNGSDAPGTVLADCSEEFRRAYEEADLIIAKGQGNYETLCDEKKNIFLLFKVKCPLVAAHSGFQIGTHALVRMSL